MGGDVRILVIGSAAGGGVPQWNCRCPVCALAWANDPRVLHRTQSSLAISADHTSWWLLNASPDLRSQIVCQPALHPHEGHRSSPIKGVVLTNGDIDHIAGLLNLREQQTLMLYGAAKTLAMLEGQTVFNVLSPAVVTQHPFELDQVTRLPDGPDIKAFAVPGKVPLFMEDESLVIGEETENTIGLEITSGHKKILYIPGCASLNDKLLARIEGADVLFFDGTTFTDDEMPRLGLSTKTAARMGHIAISGENGSMAQLAKLNIGQRIYIHINNTNPILIAQSPEYETVRAAGWHIAYDGMEVAL